MTNPQAILSDLLRVKVLFQARAIAAVMGAAQVGLASDGGQGDERAQTRA
jgi:hypothetical protein